MQDPGSAVQLFVSSFQEENRAASHQLLYEALRRCTGCSAVPFLSYGPYGKPYLSDADGLHFSITHSGAFWMCAVSTQPVGLDLQVFQDCDRVKLSSRFFHPAEDAYLRQQDHTDFFSIWAAKESFLKYTGQGITEELRAFSVVSPEGIFPAVPGLCLRLLPWQAGYALCLCTPSPCAVRFRPVSL